MTRTVSASLLLLLAACSAPAPGAELPAPLAQDEVSLVDMDGTSYRLAAGREVALVFWQTWCESCLREGPGIAAAARELEGEVDFFGVVPGPDDVVDDAEVRRVAEELGSTYPQVRDRDLALTRRFGVNGTPTIVVIGSDGAVRHHGHEPPSSWVAR
jgi:thiol-disulfide isomerase/thioredoxin